MIDKIENANKTLSRQLLWVSAADSKVPSTFAINAAMLGVLAALIPPIANWTIPGTIVPALSGILLLASMFSLALATFPRLTGPKESLIYFGGIITRNENLYVQEMRNVTDDILVEDILKQVYINAEIAQSKFSCVKWAMIQTFVSFPLWLIAIWCLYG